MKEEKEKLTQELLSEFNKIPIIDVHTHIRANSPAAENLIELVGYHYYTELCHAAGWDKKWLQAKPEELIETLCEYLPYIQHTAQYSWLIHLARAFFEVDIWSLTKDNWRCLYQKVLDKSKHPKWYQEIMKKANIEKVFLTNNFNENLENLPSEFFPCLRADNLVFTLNKKILKKLEATTNIDISNLNKFKEALDKIFDYFKKHRAMAVAISIEPEFNTFPVSEDEAEREFEKLFREDSPSSILQAYLFERLVELALQYSLPIQLMIGVLREPYLHGVPRGTDLLSPISSLQGYLYIFNKFKEVKFIISVLSEVQSQELATYTWIVHNVYASGHWWYSNIPTYIKTTLSARLESLPIRKIIGYYSDAYKIEFVLPKFAMHKRILAEVLAERCLKRSPDTPPFTEEDAQAVAERIYRTNIKELFNI
jgi:glucuronate isomerase